MEEKLKLVSDKHRMGTIRHHWLADDTHLECAGGGDGVLVDDGDVGKVQVVFHRRNGSRVQDHQVSRVEALDVAGEVAVVGHVGRVCGHLVEEEPVDFVPLQVGLYVSLHCAQGPGPVGSVDVTNSLEY